MTQRKKRWLIGLGVAAGCGFVAVLIAASVLAKRFQPIIREQAIQYLRERFQSDVELAELRVHMPKASTLEMLLKRGRGVLARVEGQGISMRHRSTRTVPPLFSIGKFSFDVDLGSLLDETKVVSIVSLERLEINIPPPNQRPKAESGTTPQASPQKRPAVFIDKVVIKDAKLVVLPKEESKPPLSFAISALELKSVGPGSPMKYEAVLTNAKPPGRIESSGIFGPWNAGEPGDTALAGRYTFKDADLGVFSGIAGTLTSSGEFKGFLDSINVKGEASVPNFRLKMAGNPVPLSTNFEVQVDGTNGNTILQPVKAKLGSTNFTTSGGVIKHEGDRRRSISLVASMPNGNLRDVLRLAMKGSPFMEGRIALNTRIDIPPLVGKVREKLLLDGKFRISDGRFLRSTIQDQIDGLSRRGQGQPKSESIDEVVSVMMGNFRLENEVITFRSLTFGVPGADVALAGRYDLDGDSLDFRGALKLRAKVSQTMTGWKRWALKPVDPFFAKQGAGTFLRIKIVGSSRHPQFGLDR